MGSHWVGGPSSAFLCRSCRPGAVVPCLMPTVLRKAACVPRLQETPGLRPAGSAADMGRRPGHWVPEQSPRMGNCCVRQEWPGCGTLGPRWPGSELPGGGGTRVSAAPLQALRGDWAGPSWTVGPRAKETSWLLQRGVLEGIKTTCHLCWFHGAEINRHTRVLNQQVILTFQRPEVQDQGIRRPVPHPQPPWLEGTLLPASSSFGRWATVLGVLGLQARGSAFCPGHRPTLSFVLSCLMKH